MVFPSRNLGCFRMKKECLIFLILLSISYLYFQNILALDWDFMVYVLNSEYFVGKNWFFEIERAPLASFLMAPFSLFSRNLARFCYPALVFFLYLLSIRYLCKRFKLEFWVFLLFALNPFVLRYGLTCGTELLSLSLLIFSCSFFSRSWLAGVFLGLGILARYQAAIFFPVFLGFQAANSKSLKQVLNFSLGTVIPILPWLLFNFYLTGHLFYSFFDSYARNVAFLKYSEHSLFSLILPFNLYLPLFFLGVFYLARKKEYWQVLFGLIWLICGFLIYFQAKLWVERYLFFSTFPIALFSYFGFLSCKEKIRKVLEPTIFFGLVAAIIFLFLTLKPAYYSQFEEFPVNKTCLMMSDRFVIFDWLGYKAIPPFLSLGKEDFERKVEKYSENYTLILFDHNLTIHSKRCLKETPRFLSFSEALERDFNLSSNPCIYVLGEKICKVLPWI